MTTRKEWVISLSVALYALIVIIAAVLAFLSSGCIVEETVIESPSDVRPDCFTTPGAIAMSTTPHGFPPVDFAYDREKGTPYQQDNFDREPAYINIWGWAVAVGALDVREMTVPDIAAVMIGPRSDHSEVEIFAAGQYASSPLIVGVHQPYIGKLPSKFTVRSRFAETTSSSALIVPDGSQLELVFFRRAIPPIIPCRRDMARKEFSVEGDNGVGTLSRNAIIAGRHRFEVALRGILAVGGAATITIIGHVYVPVTVAGSVVYVTASEVIQVVTPLVGIFSAIVPSTVPGQDEFGFKRYDRIEVVLDVTVGTLAGYGFNILAWDE